MGLINPIIDTESIGKHIGTKIYQIANKRGITQTEIAKKLGVSTPSISFLMTGKKATSNLDQYWRIAEAIPITRKEFDEIVQEAKEKVLGKAPEEDVEVAFFAKKGITDKTKQDAIIKMIDAFKDV